MVFVWANFTTTLTFLDLHTSSHPYPGVYSNIFPGPYMYVLPGNLLDIDSGMHFSSSIWHSWHSVRHFFWGMYVLDVWWSNCAQEKMSSMHPEHSKIQSMHFETEIHHHGCCAAHLPAGSVLVTPFNSNAFYCKRVSWICHEWPFQPNTSTHWARTCLSSQMWKLG